MIDREDQRNRKKNPPDLEINCNNYSSPDSRGSLASQQEILKLQLFYMKGIFKSPMSNQYAVFYR